MKVVKVIASNGREMYYRVSTSGKKVRITKEKALASENPPEKVATSSKSSKKSTTKAKTAKAKPKANKKEKVFTIKEVLTKSPTGFGKTIKVEGFLLTSFRKVPKKEQKFELCSAFLETWPPQCSDPSLEFTLDAKKAKTFLEKISEQSKLTKAYYIDSKTDGELFSEERIVVEVSISPFMEVIVQV